MTEYHTGGQIRPTDAEVRAGEEILEQWMTRERQRCPRCGCEPVETSLLCDRDARWTPTCSCHPWARQHADPGPFPVLRRLLWGWWRR